MENMPIHEIIKTCLAIDAMAARIYRTLFAKSEAPDLKVLWNKMAAEEIEHMRFWKELSRLSKDGIFPEVFESPGQLLADIRKIKLKTRELLEQSRKGPDIGAAFLIAARLEFYALHPAFEVLFQTAGMLDGTKFSMEHEYEAHIDDFIEAMIKYDTFSPELELLGESLKRLWKTNRFLARQSLLDELTGILNRRGFFNITRPFGNLAQRNQYTVGILLVDIDHFKAVNDRYGHQSGDEVLRTVAGILKDNLRASDILGRYGGEEFIVFISAGSPESLAAAAEKLRSRVEVLTKSRIAVTVSIGLSYGRLEKDTEQEIRRLISAADNNLYEAKQQGRNRICCTSDNEAFSF